MVVKPEKKNHASMKHGFKNHANMKERKKIFIIKINFREFF